MKEPCPLLDSNGRWKVNLEKSAEREQFQTWDQIERRINRGGLSKEEIAELWSVLFLDKEQVVELLAHVKENARYGFIYPMFAFTAYTGARRSEVLRSHIDDFDFVHNQVHIREKKRRKDKRKSTRWVPLHPNLRSVIESWLDIHPGGPFTIQPPLEMPRAKPRTEYSGLTINQANCHFGAVLKNSRWSVLTGFHVLRHSFGSNLARTGKVPTDEIALWMGHTTMEMKRLYRHLFPQDGVEKISVLS